ncbi:hypothetical protein VFPPC_15538 [Pochonia chlamydosporia 170]|uniref:Uncharacterized protein n=1 Tax=Pochonia chlamydosporia 170 TaxID=1380566 RepID=A0A179FWU9_METCM|nr:hypothetical protein VFPPC_15538 [Pochonia chlamydosporia 170]OAQ70135.1 hypothetical protein VFPPC_15538 [Pochonia chlamydosporia 170]
MVQTLSTYQVAIMTVLRVVGVHCNKRSWMDTAQSQSQKVIWEDQKFRGFGTRGVCITPHASYWIADNTQILPFLGDQSFSLTVCQSCADSSDTELRRRGRPALRIFLNVHLASMAMTEGIFVFVHLDQVGHGATMVVVLESPSQLLDECTAPQAWSEANCLRVTIRKRKSGLHDADLDMARTISCCAISG